MGWKKLTAIVRAEKLGDVEKRLTEIGVGGISVSQIKGYGEYKNFFAGDMMITHARLEIFVDAARVDAIARAIMDVSHYGQPGDGIIAVLPVDRVYRIRSKEEALPEDV